MTEALDTAAFAAQGFAVVPGVLSEAEAAELYAAFDELPMVAEESAIIGWRSEANERALAADPRFLGVLTRPALVDAVRAVIGDGLQLIDYVAMETGPGSGKLRGWHVDLPFFAHPACLSVIAAVYLQDMTGESGVLHVLPGSHARGRTPRAEEHEAELDGEVAVPVRAGSAVVFNSQLWHTGTRNASPRPRRALFPHFAHYWMKRMDEFYETPLPPAVAESGDPLLRQLFGLELAGVSVWGPGYARGRVRV